MKEPLDLSNALINKAAHDLRAAEIGLENEAPLDTVAFHLQQCAEELIKAFSELQAGSVSENARSYSTA